MMGNGIQECVALPYKKMVDALGNKTMGANRQTWLKKGRAVIEAVLPAPALPTLVRAYPLKMHLKPWVGTRWELKMKRPSSQVLLMGCVHISRLPQSHRMFVLILMLDMTRTWSIHP